MCIRRAVEMCGLGTASLREIRTDKHHRIDIDDLLRAIKSDRESQTRIPMMIIGTAGFILRFDKFSNYRQLMLVR